MHIESLNEVVFTDLIEIKLSLQMLRDVIWGACELYWIALTNGNIVIGSEYVSRLYLTPITSEPQDKVESGLFLDIVIGKGSIILELPTSEDESLLVSGDTLLAQDLHLNILDGVPLLHTEGDAVTNTNFHEYLGISKYIGINLADCFCGCY
jgi:hypothetical protein